MMFNGDGYLAYQVLEGFRQRIGRDTGDSEKYTDRFEIQLRTREAERRMTVWSIETPTQFSLLEVSHSLMVTFMSVSIYFLYRFTEVGQDSSSTLELVVMLRSN